MATIFYGNRHPFNPILYPGVMFTSFTPICELPTDDLEVIFREMNVVDGFEIPIDLRVRSMSVGDMVVVGRITWSKSRGGRISPASPANRGYICAPAGWEDAEETLVNGVLTDVRKIPPKFNLRCR